MATILVADDVYPLRQIVRITCENIGHEVHESVDGPSTVEAYLRLSPDLLVLDLQMPGGGGDFVLRTLRFDGRRRLAPVLVVTGAAELPAEEIRRKHGVDRVLLKPFRLGDVASAVTQLLVPAAGTRPPARGAGTGPEHG